MDGKFYIDPETLRWHAKCKPLGLDAEGLDEDHSAANLCNEILSLIGDDPDFQIDILRYPNDGIELMREHAGQFQLHPRHHGSRDSGNEMLDGLRLMGCGHRQRDVVCDDPDEGTQFCGACSEEYVGARGAGKTVMNREIVSEQELIASGVTGHVHEHENVGSSFDSFLEDEGIRDEVDVEATKKILAEIQRVMREIHERKEMLAVQALEVETCEFCGLRPKVCHWVIQLIWGEPLVERLECVCDRGHHWYVELGG